MRIHIKSIATIKRFILMVVLLGVYNNLQAQNTPVDIASLEVWYAADSVSIASGKVDTIFDMSSNNYHLYQSNATYQPVSQTDTILNNNNKLVFTSDYLSCENMDFSFTDSITIISLYKQNNYNGGIRFYQHSTDGLFNNDKTGFANFGYADAINVMHGNGNPPRTQYVIGASGFIYPVILTSIH
ncbi:MAG: hypothetical protein ACOC2M_00920, partial [bacterium]